MDGIISIKELVFPAILGINPAERLHEQRLSLNIEIRCDFSLSRNAQCCESTVDWAKTATTARTFIQEHRFYLAETAVLGLAELLLENPLAKAVKVQLAKLEADIGAAELSASIELVR